MNDCCISVAFSLKFLTASIFLIAINLKQMTQCNCYSLLAVSVWCAQFILHSSNAVIFAVN